jgi:hypothetical protein
VIALALGASVVASLMIPAPGGASPGAVAAGGTDEDGAAPPPYVTLDSEPLPPNDDLAAVDASAATGHPDVTEAPPRR